MFFAVPNVAAYADDGVVEISPGLNDLDALQQVAEKLLHLPKQVEDNIAAGRHVTLIAEFPSPHDAHTVIKSYAYDFDGIKVRYAEIGDTVMDDEIHIDARALPADLRHRGDVIAALHVKQDVAHATSIKTGMDCYTLRFNFAGDDVKSVDYITDSGCE